MRHLPPGEGNDPGLSTAGVEQARKLVTLLGKKRIKAIFVTNTRRSRETAAALAANLRLVPTTYDAAQPDRLVDAVKAVPGDVLVVGHSNTVHDLVGRLGGEAPAPLAHGDFGTIWRISGGRTSTLLLDGQ